LILRIKILNSKREIVFNFGYCPASLCFVEGGIPQRAAIIYLGFAARWRNNFEFPIAVQSL